MAKIQKWKKQKITYDEAITFLLDREAGSLEVRREFARKYRGIIEEKQAKQDLIKARKIEK